MKQKSILNSKSSKEEKAEKLSEIALKTVDIKGIGLLYPWKEKKRNHSR